jgi:hypothetical protein
MWSNLLGVLVRVGAPPCITAIRSSQFFPNYIPSFQSAKYIISSTTMKQFALVLALILSVAILTRGELNEIVSRADSTPGFMDKGLCDGVAAICQDCCAATSTSEACSTWRDTGIDWDNEGTSNFWNLFGAFDSRQICTDLSTRASQRIDQELREKCNVQRNPCRTINSDFNNARNKRNCDSPQCLFFFLFCSIECTQISCIYDLNCDA